MSRPCRRDLTNTLFTAEPGVDPSDFQMLITTANWLITHQSRFHLRRTYNEDDLDGTDSEVRIMQDLHRG